MALHRHTRRATPRRVVKPGRLVKTVKKRVRPVGQKRRR